jgi:hypothetical protein
VLATDEYSLATCAIGSAVSTVIRHHTKQHRRIDIHILSKYIYAARERGWIDGPFWASHRATALHSIWNWRRSDGQTRWKSTPTAGHEGRSEGRTCRRILPGARLRAEHAAQFQERPGAVLRSVREEVCFDTRLGGDQGLPGWPEGTWQEEGQSGDPQPELCDAAQPVRVADPAGRAGEEPRGEAGATARKGTTASAYDARADRHALFPDGGSEGSAPCSPCSTDPVYGWTRPCPWTWRT